MSQTVFTKPLLAFAVMALLAGPAFAEKHTAPADAPAAAKMGGKHHRGGMIRMDEGDLDKVEKMSPAQRDAYFKERREAFKKMSPEERKELRAKRKAWFDGLPKEKQEAIKARHEKMREEFKARKKAEFDKMTPEQQAKIKARMEAHKGKGAPASAPAEEGDR